MKLVHWIAGAAVVVVAVAGCAEPKLENEEPTVPPEVHASVVENALRVMQEAVEDLGRAPPPMDNATV